MWQVFGFILIDRYVTLVLLSPAEFPGKIAKFLQSLAAVIVLPAWLLALTLYICTSIHINILHFYNLEQ